MILAEPPLTQADLRFRLFGIPVRVHPFFWIVALVLGVGGGEAKPVDTLLWIAVVFVSIVVHELGHAFLQRRYGGHPWITLYGMGGLASCDDCDRSPRSQILISLAGPLAGFILAAAIIASIWLSGHRVEFGRFPGLAGWLIPFWEQFEAPIANILILDLLYVNIFWGLINMLPIYPLDGGRISRELFTLGKNPSKGIVQSLWLSAVAAGLVAVYGLSQGSIYMAVLFGYLAYSSYQTLQAYQRSY
jgi:Zn-dependent protease